MKRSALQRKTALRTTRPLQRKTRLRKVRHDRIRSRRAKCFGDQAALCRTLACLVAGECWGTVVPHHEPPRSVGGTDQSCVPLCDGHHGERHSIGRPAFEAKYGVDLKRTAEQMRAAVALMKPRAA